MSELTLHNLKTNKGATKKPKRLGRGNASGSGTYSGRGIKGQRSRSGGKGGLKRLGLKHLLKSKPKIGGFKSLKPKMETVNIKDLEQFFNDGELINAKKLIAKGLVGNSKSGIKVLGEGKLSKKFTVVVRGFSNSAKEAIIKAGGKIEIK